MTECLTISPGFPGLVQRQFNGPHEAYAVLLEEVEEFWGEVRKQRPDPIDMLNELAQIGAMAQRIAEDVVDPMFLGKEGADASGV